MKYYIASLIAFTNVQDSDESTPLFLSMTVPVMFPAESIEQAGELARELVFERWKPEEGWHTHQSNILPVSGEIYDSIFEMANADALEVDDSPGLTFSYGDERSPLKTGETHF